MGVVAGKRVKVAPVVVIPHEKDLAVAEVAQRPRPWRPPGVVVGDPKVPATDCHGVPATATDKRGPAPSRDHAQIL